MKNRSFISLFILAVLITGCEQVQKATDILVHRSAREIYERNFPQNDSLLAKWKDAFIKAEKDSLRITLPYSESGMYSKEKLLAYSYNLQLKQGERLVIEVEKQPDSARVFLDLFIENKEKTFKLVKSAEDKETSLTHAIDQSGYYKVIVQPQMDLDFPFVLKIFSQTVYPFPVVGAENKNVKSFWADPRDAGNRSHEGIDIFADRGTPVIAVTAGRIVDVGDRGLGGKQVWLRDPSFKNTIYYAHLDSIAVAQGKRVKLGDTLGFVGNTGNAKTLPPHLHFGIYKTTGAINPLPYIRKSEIRSVENPSTITRAVVSKKAEINKGPALAFGKLGSLMKGDTISVLGKSESWFHIQTKDGLKGYVNEKSAIPLLSN